MDTALAVVPANPLSNEGTGITVELNGSPYLVTGAGFILDLSPSIVAIQEFNPQVCIGTSLLVFSFYGFWPYGLYYSLENHYSCVVNPPTCNLLINGVPIVVPATDATTADGSIQIVASSTNDIQYNLGADFVYGDGQLESIFSGLLPGSYRIYLRDSANCAVNILVEVTSSNVYGTKYRLEYTDNESIPTRVDITMRGYSVEVGGILDMELDGVLGDDPFGADAVGSGTPFEIQLRGEGETDKFTALMSSQGNLNLLSMTDAQYLELYTNDPNLYRLEYSKDFGNMTAGEGGFSPAALPALTDWTNEDTGGPAWVSDPPTVDFNLLGLNVTSDTLYTDYAFEEGREYTFNYAFSSPNASGTFKIKIFDGSFNELLNTDIIISTAFQTGQYIVTAPAGAAGIGIVVFHAPSCGSGSSFCQKAVAEFNNVTAVIPVQEPYAIGYELLWLGKVLPMQYAEEWKAPPYHVSVIATDGLAELKDHFLIQPDGQKYYGTISLIKLVSYCLSFLKLGLDIRVACNLYALEMNQEEANDPFDQAYVDFEAFYLAEKEPTLEFVLKSILEPFGCRIVQWEYRWNIIRVEELVSEYDWRQFDADGNYLSNGSTNPIIDIEYPDDSIGDEVNLVNLDHNLEIRPGYGRIKAIYSLGLKPNILNNGDFRLKSIYDPFSNTYFFDINKDGWTLVNSGYIIQEGYERIDQNNLAYTIQGGLDTSGEAYIQSDTYPIKMGTNNQLKISVRCKVYRFTSYFGTLVFTFDVPYYKVRLRVKYGSLYLQGDGSWSATESLLTFFATEFDKFLDFEIVAKQPTTGTPVVGMDFDVRVYHIYPYHVDFIDSDTSDLEALQTYDGVNKTIPTGYKTQLLTGGDIIYYYELQETSEATSAFEVVEPDDYHPLNNPRKYIRKVTVFQTQTNDTVFKMAIDKVVVRYLTDSNDPIDTITRTVTGEGSNNLTLEKPLVIGSYSNLIVTDTSFSLSLGIFFPSGGLSITTTSTLSADLIYTGYLRDINGVGYEFFARDGVAESDKLHGILLKQYALQYRRSWRLFRGSIYCNRYFGLLNVARNVNDNNRIYLPIGLTLNDKMCTWNGEFLELTNIGGDGGGAVPFTSGFTVGFGAGAFN